MKTAIGPIPEDNWLVFELLMVLGVAQLVVDGAQASKAEGLSAHFDPEIL